MTTDTPLPKLSTRPSELSSDRLIAAAQSHLEELSKLLPVDYSCTLKISYPQGGGWVLTARAVACMQPVPAPAPSPPARESQEVRVQEVVGSMPSTGMMTQREYDLLREKIWQA